MIVCSFLSGVLLFVSFESSFSEPASTNSSSEKELLFVDIIWRHGARAQVRVLPKSAYSEEDWQARGSGLGELTMRGLSQHVRFGKLLRKEYMEKRKFLSPSYSNKEVYYLSTDFNRTIISAIANSIGMFSDKEANRRNRPNDANWPDGFVAVPVHSNPNPSPYGNCPKYRALMDIVNNSKEHQQVLQAKEMQDMFKKVSQISRRNISAQAYLHYLWDELNTQKDEFEDFNNRVPWATQELMDEMLHVWVTPPYFSVYDQPFFVNGVNIPLITRKVNGGYMIIDIVNRMRMKLNCFLGKRKCKANYKSLLYFAFSAHDSTLYRLFLAFGIDDKFQQVLPDYTSAIVFELYYDKSLQKPFFQMKYHRNPSSDSFEVVTPFLLGCTDAFCPLEKLEAYAKIYEVGGSYEEFCGVPKSKRNSDEEIKTIYPTQETLNTIDSILRSTID